MIQEVVAQKVLKEMIDRKLCKETDEETVWCYLVQVYGAGYDLGYQHAIYQRGKRRPIMQIDRKGDIVKIHDSIKEAASKMKLNVATIGKALRGRYKTAGGFVWKYVDTKPATSSEETIESYQSKSDRQASKTRASKTTSLLPGSVPPAPLP